MAGVQESECLLKQGKNKRRKRNKRKENGKKTAMLLLSKWTGVLILKGVPKVLYLSFAHIRSLKLRVKLETLNIYVYIYRKAKKGRSSRAVIYFSPK